MRPPWDRAVAKDTESRNFSFSLCGHPFYIVGMHPHSSRVARRMSCFQSPRTVRKTAVRWLLSEATDIDSAERQSVLRLNQSNAVEFWRRLGSQTVQWARIRERVEIPICAKEKQKRQLCRKHKFNRLAGQCATRCGINIIPVTRLQGRIPKYSSEPHRLRSHEYGLFHRRRPGNNHCRSRRCHRVP